MKVRELEERLQELEDFDEPSVMLEQYPTTPHLAAHMMTNIDAVFNDLKDKFIVDLGVGCGMLSVAASLSGARFASVLRNQLMRDGTLFCPCLLNMIDC